MANVPFLQEQQPILNCVGQACRYIVTASQGYNMSEGCSTGQLRSHVSVHLFAGNRMEKSLLAAEQACQAEAGPCRQMKNERGSPIPDLSPAVGLT